MSSNKGRDYPDGTFMYFSNIHLTFVFLDDYDRDYHSSKRGMFNQKKKPRSSLKLFF
jgi:hypothetical protein